MSGHQTKGDKPDCRDSQPLQLAHQAQLDKRQTILRASISKLEQQIQETETQLQEVTSKLRSPEKASQTVRDHIHLLHAYNEIRDIGQGLLGLIAEARGARHIDIQNEFGVTTED
ncbi:putative DNA repair protein Swi5/Sae3 [Talaromyces proteolyticus]|uniref:DNA repair protein Swi5/Sae3 n=1 Tax=Talaromyces proteolyticus TaxID=1131652 RepID=A0AAD4L3L5_9EURO|nr:putative DNA repair protein Swi5/Sae3 [Talaromyces proteolyticus]KAH8702584.1 putative DNA repair protein Swi5/Sae3 [Talaromyces proteolyticus]